MGDDAGVVIGLCRQAQELSEAGDDEGAIRVYADVVNRFEESTDPAVIHTVAQAIHNMGLLLAVVGRPEEAVRAFDRLITKFGDSFDPELQKAAKLAEVGRMLAERQP